MRAPLLTVEQVAALLAIRPALVRTLAHRRELPYLRIGEKLLRFRPEDVETFIEKSRPGGPAEGRGVA